MNLSLPVGRNVATRVIASVYNTVLFVGRVKEWKVTLSKLHGWFDRSMFTVYNRLPIKQKIPNFFSSYLAKTLARLLDTNKQF